MSEELRPIEPVRLKMMKGEEREFLLSMGGIKRLKKRLSVKTLGEILAQDAEAAGVPILYEALLDKGELTEDQFADMMPAHIAEVTKAIGLLLGASFPDADPTKEAAPTDQMLIQ